MEVSGCLLLTIQVEMRAAGNRQLHLHFDQFELVHGTAARVRECEQVWLVFLFPARPPTHVSTHVPVRAISLGRGLHGRTRCSAI